MEEQCFKCGLVHPTEKSYLKCLNNDQDFYAKDMEDVDRDEFDLTEFEMELE